jgi:hypothetical protein
MSCDFAGSCKEEIVRSCASTLRQTYLVEEGFFENELLVKLGVLLNVRLPSDE